LGYTTTQSAGDINGYGIPDLMIGALGADFGGTSNVGEIYLIFGGSGFSFDNFDVSTLNGTNGFVISAVTAKAMIYDENLSELGLENDPEFQEDVHRFTPTFGVVFLYNRDKVYFGLSSPN